MLILKWFKYQLDVLKSYIISDENYRRRIYKKRFNKEMNLNTPKTFNEKINYRILKDKNPLYTKLADKIQVREYIKEKIGEQYLIPILGIYDSPKEINYEKLPEKFVLKCNHDSGSVIICQDKNNFNFKKAKNKLKFHLKNNMYVRTREWHYKNIIPKILCEKYLDIYYEENKKPIPEDYRLHCFHGKVEFIELQFNKFEGDKFINIYDKNWNIQPFKMSFENSNFIVDKPNEISKMIELAEVLCNNFDYCRIDFFVTKSQIFFAEITFTPCNGLDLITPEEWDYKIGNKWNLNIEYNEKNHF
ncbi:ATP-grasp fold amidoligase family protein [Xenorhabdus szentirmaii]|uniref:ATP-grasp fold amidoligase family protein n=2 Tax=Xenorhabdus szentirmaii TaxID=290112 RepID=UPI0019B4D27D|nr:ATP-grasp fold amidoligase family protein [Xenorhabdus sp. 38]MBD2781295.1 glycosyltransferase [Xenorhabdus sp. 38]